MLSSSSSFLLRRSLRVTTSLLSRQQHHSHYRPIIVESVNGRCDSNNASFSTAAAAVPSTAMEEPTPRTSQQQRQRRKKLDPIIVTENAANRIKEILSGENAAGAIGIRLGVKRRGCNGLSYTLNYAFDRQPKDEEMMSHGVTVFIEPMALFNVVGTVMDYEETELASEFTFQNPNAKGECGCGESFNV